MFAEVALLMATSLPCALRAIEVIGKRKPETGNRKMSAHQFSGRFLSPRVFSAYYTPFSKSRRFLTLINAFLCLRHQKEWALHGELRFVEITCIAQFQVPRFKIQ